MKTVLITGCSSGYGLETARSFTSRAGTSSRRCGRRVQRFCPSRGRMRVVALDVTSVLKASPQAVAAQRAHRCAGQQRGIGAARRIQATSMIDRARSD